MKLYSLLVVGLIVVEVGDHLQAVPPELVVEQPVGGLDGGEDGHQVEGLPEGKAQLVAGVLVTVVDELVGYFLRLTKPPSLGLLVILLFPTSFYPILLLLLILAGSLLLTSSSNLHPVLVPVLFLAGENVTDQLVFKVFLPNGVGQLAEEKEEGQKVGQPEVVGGDGAIILGDISLIHVASGGGI